MTKEQKSGSRLRVYSERPAEVIEDVPSTAEEFPKVRLRLLDTGEEVVVNDGAAPAMPSRNELLDHVKYWEGKRQQYANDYASSTLEARGPTGKTIRSGIRSRQSEAKQRLAETRKLLKYAEEVRKD